jgi:CRISPR-associated protein Csd1
VILKRLYDFAEREHLLDDLAFESMPVPFIVNINADGKYLGIDERRGTKHIPTNNDPHRTKPDKGKELLVPKPHGNTANPGFSRFFVDTLARVLPVSDEAKSVASRQTFWCQMRHAADQTGDAALKALCNFDDAVRGDATLAHIIKADVEAFKPGPGDRCTFALYDDDGTTILERSSVQEWWRSYYAKFDQDRQNDGPVGVCQITGQNGPRATSHPSLPMIPGGLPGGVRIVSNDKDAFLSYNLDASANAAISFRGADGYTRALTALLQNKPSHSKVTIGQVTFLFWTRKKCDISLDISAIENAAPATVESLLKSVPKGMETLAIDANDFYCLTLSGNSARVVIRDYLETPVSAVRQNLAAWFRDLRIIEPWGKEQTTAFPLWQLALATALDSDAVSPSTPPLLMEAALRRHPLPDTILANCLKRLSAEGGSGFRAIRLGLIKLVLNRKDHAMTEELDPARTTPAYLCGRLMAVFERVQWGALSTVNATVVDRFYGTASTAPGLIFPRLFKSAQQHLGKLHSENPGMAVNLQKNLESLCAGIAKFPNLLTLPQQGEFALGFYHQRADYRKGHESIIKG